MWLKWSFAPAPFTGTYVLGFIIVLPLIGTMIFWAISGFMGWRSLLQSRGHSAWCVFLILLTGWTIISQAWAFGLQHYPGMAQNSALQLVLVAGFVIVVAAASPPPKVILAVLIFSMLIHGAIGGLQVIFQGEIGLSWFGEFSLDVTKSGISVLESDGQRWLRPYGLLPHPNILAGIITTGLLASAVWILDSGKKQPMGGILFLIGFWFLLLTFSRGAWIGFAVGALFALPFIWRLANFWKNIIQIVIGTVIVGTLFVAIFYPLLLSRAGISEQNTELRSVSDRIVYMDIARDAIEKHPLRGVGAGNFPWYASNYLFYKTDYDLRGDNVHNIYLTVFSELGLIGFVLFMGMIASGIGAILQKRDTERIALLAIFVAWAIIGLFDHYIWTVIQTQTLWIGLLAVGMSGIPETASPEKINFRESLSEAGQEPVALVEG